MKFLFLSQTVFNNDLVTNVFKTRAMNKIKINKQTVNNIETHTANTDTANTEPRQPTQLHSQCHVESTTPPTANTRNVTNVVSDFTNYK